MTDPKFLQFETLSLHAGQQPDPATGARAVPIYQTASYVFNDTEHAASLFNLERAGHIYSRISNPTTAVLEERLAALEGGVGTVCTASGQAALHLGVATLMGAGGHIVSAMALYGGSHNLFTHTLPRFGITTTFVDPRDVAAFRNAIRPETRLLFGETLGNPGLEELELPALAEVAHAAGVPLMVDATFTTPYLSRPFEHGADLIMQSSTKFLGGHGVAIGGAFDQLLGIHQREATEVLDDLDNGEFLVTKTSQHDIEARLLLGRFTASITTSRGCHHNTAPSSWFDVIGILEVVT